MVFKWFTQISAEIRTRLSLNFSYIPQALRCSSHHSFPLWTVGLPSKWALCSASLDATPAFLKVIGTPCLFFSLYPFPCLSSLPSWCCVRYQEGWVNIAAANPSGRFFFSYCRFAHAQNEAPPPFALWTNLANFGTLPLFRWWKVSSWPWWGSVQVLVRACVSERWLCSFVGDPYESSMLNRRWPNSKWLKRCMTSTQLQM